MVVEPQVPDPDGQELPEPELLLLLLPPPSDKTEPITPNAAMPIAQYHQGQAESFV